MKPKSVGDPRNPFDGLSNMAGNWVGANLLPSLVQNNGIDVIQAGYGDWGCSLGASGIGPPRVPAAPSVAVDRHELADAMGRESDGAFDLLRSASAQQDRLSASPYPDSDTALPAYFSTDGANINLGDRRQALSPSDILNSGIQGTADTFHSFHTSGTRPASDGLFGGPAQAAALQGIGAPATAGSFAQAISATSPAPGSPSSEDFDVLESRPCL